MNQLSNKERVNSEGISISRFRHCNIGNSLKIEHWKLNIGLSALLFFLWCTQASAATFGVPSNYLTLGQGLVGHWTFDGKDVASNVRDRSGQGNHGFLTGQTSTTTAIGRLGQALLFDGVDDYVESNTQLVSDYPFTTTGWVKTTDTAGTIIFLVDKDVANVQYGIWITSGLAQIRARNTAIVETGTCSVADDQWHHVVGVFTSATSREIFVDGVSCGTTSTSVTYNPAVDRWSIGRQGDSTPSDFTNGSVDDVRIYNRALRADEIKALYQSGSVTVGVSRSANPADALSQGLVGHWTMDGPDLIQNVSDRSGQGNAGFMSNFTSTSTAQIIGRLGQALTFDGTNDVVQVNSNAGVTTYPFTLVAWAKLIGTAPQSIAFIGNSGSTQQYADISANAGIYRLVSRYDGAADSLTSGVSVDGNWHHVVGVFASDTQRELFVDGVSRGTDTTQHNFTANRISIGRLGDQSPDDWANGAIDDVRIYNRALRADEVKRLYEQSVGAKQAATPVGVAGTGLNAGLVGHWTFDGPDLIRNVADRSGLGNHGALAGFTATSSVIGRMGQALLFDGVDDRVRTTDFFYSDKLSVCVWINPRAYGSTKNIVTKRNLPTGEAVTSSTSLDEWQLTLENGIPEFASFDEAGDDTFVDASGAVATNKWTHLCGVQNGAGSVQYMYVDGVQSGVGSTQVNAMRDATALVQIGVRTANNDTRYWDGFLDDVRIYNRALSADEIRQLYTMGR